MMKLAMEKRISNMVVFFLGAMAVDGLVAVPNFPDVTVSEESNHRIMTLIPETEIQDSSTPDVTTSLGVDTPTMAHRTANFLDNTTRTVPKADPFAIIHQGTVSKEQYERCNVIINLILKPIVCIGGIIMNVIGVCVLLQKQFRRSTYTYLLFLALSDIFLLSCSLLRIIPQFVTYFDDIIANRMDMYLYPYNTIFLANSFTRITEFCICALAVERFFAVLYPLKVKELFLCRHAYAVCVAVWLFCFLAHFPFLFVYYPKPYFNPSRNVTMWTLGRNPWYTDLGIKPVYDMILQIIFLYVLIIVLVICNIGILIRVRQLNNERRHIVANDIKSEKMSRDEKRMTVTLLIISLVFLAVFLPVIMMTLLSKVNKEFKYHGREHYLLLMLRDLVGFGSNVSSANDFVVYIYTSKHFKKALLDMVCIPKGKEKAMPSTGDSQMVTAITVTATEGTSVQT